MKITAIKKLVETVSIEQLIEAEQAIINESSLPVEVEGDDEGEQLTHVIAAVWILDRMKDPAIDFKTALRDYTKMVRESIN